MSGSMFVSVRPKLSARAAQQLRKMGTDVAYGYQRLRSLQRSLSKNRERLEALRGKLSALSVEKSSLERNHQNHPRYSQVEREISECNESTKDINASCAALEAEREQIATWHTPSSRLLTALLAALGVSSIEHAIPDFDDGISEDLRLARGGVR